MKMKLLKVALILSLLLFGAQLPTVEASTLDGETTVNLNVRSTASTTGTLITTLPKGTKVKYGTHNQSWHKVYLNNRTYYASAQYIKPLAPAPITTQAASSTGVTTENLNIRITSHRDAQIVTTLKKGTEVQYAAHNTSWVKVFLSGKTYYAAKAYIAPKVVTATPQKQTGYTNRTIELFNRTLQTSPVVKTIPANRTVTFSIHNSSWSVIYEGTSTFFTPTRGITAGTLQPSVTKENGYANREMKLFETRNQASKVMKVLPINSPVVSSKYNSSWSVVYDGNATYYTPTAWITPGPAPVQPPTTTTPEPAKVQGYANRNANLFGQTHQSSPVQLVLPQYTAVTYSAHNSSWSVVYIGTKTYFTPTSWLTAGKAPAAPAPAPQGKVYTNTPGDALNVRSAATVNSTVLGKLAHGTEVEHYGLTSGFYKIKYNGRDGFISAGFTMATKPSVSKGPVIVIDPGHGGKDPGALNGSLYEKTVVLDVSKRIESYLSSKYNYQVRLTRSTDIYYTPQQRPTIARDLRGELFVSIHANSSTDKTANGIETFYSGSTSQSARSRVLATNIQNNLVSSMSGTGMRNRGVKTANFAVINHSLMPSALVELGFITSPTDVVHLRSEASRQRMAQGIAEGIAQYVRTYY
ncbi:N-acetylmuramoyl-L-alanine amidase [Exiguobacterium alkaliphilum]|uniref:N-acetylmuramoyl-L-alanine amidase n=1 Tax=Exiguobacterium alkaliphilum TaxID=1428684 RepID=UPI001BABC7BB|nr:N-acetylmuramoyl-L-alanine amidase [Exiguobacterium alkaliphilum]QUE87556.1 N-acetylmuramoyl-L-alanine amidase [Exiguobacterium alkaliphilum]